MTHRLHNLYGRGGARPEAPATTAVSWPADGAGVSSAGIERAGSGAPFGLATLRESASRSRVLLSGLMAIQLLVGFEWLVSGIAKLLQSDFISGLAADLRDRSAGATGWYKSFLDHSVIPHAGVFGYFIEVGELLIGVALIAAAVLWLLRWQRLPLRAKYVVLAATILASLAGVFMNVNFHLANGSPHPWLIPSSGFDEGLDFDSFLPAIQLALIGVSVAIWLSLRRTARVSAIGDGLQFGAASEAGRQPDTGASASVPGTRGTDEKIDPRK